MSAAPVAAHDRSSPAGTNPSSSHLFDTAALTAPRDVSLPVRPSDRELAVAHSSRVVPWSRLAEPRPYLPLGMVAFVLMVALPMALGGIYYFFIAADQYVAEFRFGLRSAEPVRSDPGLLLQAGAAPSQIGLDSYVVVQYIASRAIVDDLSKTLDLQQMFSTARADWPARLHLPAPVEDLVTYWRGQVDAFFDPADGTIVVKARAFAPEDALKLAQGILVSSERLVNDLSARARSDARGYHPSAQGDSLQRPSQARKAHRPQSVAGCRPDRPFAAAGAGGRGFCSYPGQSAFSCDRL